MPGQRSHPFDGVRELTRLLCRERVRRQADCFHLLQRWTFFRQDDVRTGSKQGLDVRRILVAGFGDLVHPRIDRSHGLSFDRRTEACDDELVLCSDGKDKLCGSRGKGCDAYDATWHSCLLYTSDAADERG